ncbi:unnamed protein product [Haemonchus placei]|uniref:Uncharacterized protein n=1 Tax=Haemonchus placei TaxID=6290 RepID=A0A0N4WG96_HAEPC|nr:unnamed protein product [Haemonchus placei]
MNVLLRKRKVPCTQLLTRENYISCRQHFLIYATIVTTHRQNELIGRNNINFVLHETWSQTKFAKATTKIASHSTTTNSTTRNTIKRFVFQRLEGVDEEFFLVKRIPHPVKEISSDKWECIEDLNVIKLALRKII